MPFHLYNNIARNKYICRSLIGQAALQNNQLRLVLYKETYLTSLRIRLTKASARISDECSEGHTTFNTRISEPILTLDIALGETKEHEQDSKAKGTERLTQNMLSMLVRVSVVLFPCKASTHLSLLCRAPSICSTISRRSTIH